MDTNKLVTCCKCGWVSFQVTKDYAINSINEFNKYYNGLSKDQQKLYYGSKPATIEVYEHCFFCNGSYKNFRNFKEGDCPDGVTLNPIINRHE